MPFKVATEARIAAFAARDQTNPKKYGDLLGQTLDSHLGATADAMTEIVRRLGVQTDKTIGVLANRKMTGPKPIERCSNGNRKRIVSKAACLGLVWVIDSGLGADGDASSFLGQQRFHMRCPRCLLDHDNHGC